MSAPGDTLKPLYLPDAWPGGRAPAIWEVERDRDGWRCGAFLWCPDEPGFDNGLTGPLWFVSGWCHDFVAAVRRAIGDARELERERDELLDGIERLRADAGAMLA